MIETVTQYILKYGAPIVSFLARVFLSTASVVAAFQFRQHGMDMYLILAVILGWMWFIWHKWE